MQDDWALFREFVGSNADPQAAQAYVDALLQPGRYQMHCLAKPELRFFALLVLPYVVVVP